jgi:hypothetical protein
VRSYPFATSLRMHLETRHPGASLPCPGASCSRVYQTFRTFMSHVRKYHKERLVARVEDTMGGGSGSASALGGGARMAALIELDGPDHASAASALAALLSVPSGPLRASTSTLIASPRSSRLPLAPPPRASARRNDTASTTDVDNDDHGDDDDDDDDDGETFQP